MKQLHFKTIKGEFLLVEDDGNFPRDFPYEFYEGIGYIDDLTDGDKWDVVEPSNGGEYFKNYEEYGYEYATASESFDSLLKSLGVHFENPISNDDRSRFAEWVEWRKKVWDKENTYLFRKIMNANITVIAPEECEDYLTAGKEYEIISENKTLFTIKDDECEEIHCLFKKCSHLNNGDWILKN